MLSLKNKQTLWRVSLQLPIIFCIRIRLCKSQDRSGHAEITNKWKVSVVKTTQVYVSFTLDVHHRSAGGTYWGQGSFYPLMQGPRLMDQPQSYKPLFVMPRGRESSGRPHIGKEIFIPPIRDTRHFCLPLTGWDQWHALPDKRECAILPKETLTTQRAQHIQGAVLMITGGPRGCPRLSYDHRAQGASDPGPLEKRCMQGLLDDLGCIRSVGERVLVYP